MKIVIAPDSFKGSLSAQEAASAMERGVHAAIPDAEIDTIPMADGGEGTLEALVSSTNGIFKEAQAVDPLGRPMQTKYGILGNSKTAVIEMAAVSGLLLLKKEERNPLDTTTYGTGQLIRHALESGCTEFIVCIGGSSTNDCGAGMAQALGIHFFRKDKTEITDKMCGGLLGDVAFIETSGLHPAIQQSRIIAACDVKNPLLGKRGCAQMYSKQKGATIEIINQLENNMESFIDLAEKITQKSVRDFPGAGAAGGLGAGLMLFLGADLQPGISLVMDVCNFSERMKDADLILTGEGKIDNQTAFGKSIAGIALCAKSMKIPVIAFGGIVENAVNLNELGVTAIFPISQPPITIEQAMAEAPALLQNTVERVMWEYKKLELLILSSTIFNN
ncbi:MAG: glycerate kinase [Bacteroidota bacterium]|jgi:glycerate kinase